MYYSLSTDGQDNVYMEKMRGLNGHIGLGMGRAWDIIKDEIDIPYHYTMRVVSGETPRLYAWYPGSHLMQQRLVDVLRSSGVDNLQTFPAEIRREDTDQELPGYVVVNIVGRISCANMQHSDSSPLADVHYFANLTIDPSSIHGQRIFRVNESPMIVLVHEDIARAIEGGNFIGLTLDAVKEIVPDSR